jgi:hypothetical protein
MPRWILVIFAVAAMLSGTATAGSVAPNEVCIYEHVDYLGARACFSLEPGMRHKLVPTLDRMGMNDRASSVQVGEGVNVVIYEHARFGGRSYRHDISVRTLVRPTRPGSRGFNVRTLMSNFNDIVSSLIIVPKQTVLSGVTLRPQGLGGSLVFYPLPERLNDLEARYPNLHWMDMNDKAKIVELHGSVKVTLYEHDNFLGESLMLPGVGDQNERFYLDQYYFGGLVSSLVVSPK